MIDESRPNNRPGRFSQSSEAAENKSSSSIRTEAAPPRRSVEADFSGEQLTASAENSVNLFQPSATLWAHRPPTTMRRVPPLSG